VAPRKWVGNGLWQTVRSVKHTFCDGIEAHGNLGDLKTVIIRDAGGAAIDTSYYRYYVASEANGYQHGLKFAVHPRSFERLAAAVADPFTATDAALSPFADHFFEYDAYQRVTKEVVQGEGCSSCAAGLGTYTFSYTISTNANSVNQWKVRTVETLPDGNQHIVYTNAYGEIMLKVFKEVGTGREWATFYQYDLQGRPVLVAEPSAVSGYNDAYADLLHWDGNDYEFLRDTQGLIHRYGFGTTTTATETDPGDVTGLLQYTASQRGETTTPSLQEVTRYFVRTAGGVAVYPVAMSTDFRNPSDTSPGGRLPQTTYFDYTWHSGTTQPESVTVRSPMASAAQNGPGLAAETTTYFDGYGRPVWVRDADGYLSYTEFDPATGAAVKTITDVDTTRTADFTGLPSGWGSPAPTGATAVARFDFGTAASAVDGGHTRVAGTTLYAATTGYGWLGAGVSALDRSLGDDLRRDINYGPDGTFVVDVPDGSHDVTLTVGDYHVAHDQVGIYLEGALVDTVSTAAHEHVTQTYRVTVADGQLTVRLLDLGGADANFAINGLEVAPPALHLTTLLETDSLGRTTKVTAPNGTVHYTVYNDTADEVRSYAWDPATNEPVGPVQVTREDRGLKYTESFTFTAPPTYTWPAAPDGSEPIGTVHSLSQSIVNDAGQVVATDQYFDLTGVTFSQATATLGTEWDPSNPTVGNYYRTEYAYTNRGWLNREVSPAGTITRFVHDGPGRVVSTWVGTDDEPTSGVWSPTNTAGTDLVMVSENEYDGGGIGDGNLTKVTAHPGGGAAARVTAYAYDWRDRLIATKQGVESSESTGVNRPMFYVELDNLGRVVVSEQYDGDGVSITADANADGVPDRPASNLLRAKTTTDYDDLGRVFRTKTFSVNPTTGAVSANALTSNVWYDLRGNVIKTSQPGGPVTKVL
jgi:hypothetical protein